MLLMSLGDSCRNAVLPFRKPRFYPLNYGNRDICDFRFLIADCKLRTGADLTSSYCCDCARGLLGMGIIFRAGIVIRKPGLRQWTTSFVGVVSVRREERSC